MVVVKVVLKIVVDLVLGTSSITGSGSIGLSSIFYCIDTYVIVHEIEVLCVRYKTGYCDFEFNYRTNHHR